MEQLEASEAEVRQNMENFHKEREELRERVEKTLTLLATLEAR